MTYGHDIAADAEPTRADVDDYVDAAYGDATGRAHIAVGRGGHFDASGAYKFPRSGGWVPRSYAWPAERDQITAEILRASTESDVYLCPYLMRGGKRTPGDAVELTKIHADIDGDCPLDKVAEINGWVVSTGSPGHAHVYVDLAEPISAHWHTALCRGLGAHLGHADAKIRPNDVLRPPGTFNHKSRARGGESTAVEWLIRPTGVCWDLAKLAAKLGVELSDPDAPPAASTRTTASTQATATADDGGQPFDLNAYPRVRRAMADVSTPPDRSVDTMKVIAAVHDAGLTLENARWAVAQRADLCERLDGRRADDVLTCWLKIDSDRRAGAAANAAAAATAAQYRDAYISERIARDYLCEFVHSSAFGWRQWDGRRWAAVDVGVVLDTVRRAVIELHTTAAMGGAEVASLQEIDALLGERRIVGILKLCTGIRTVEARNFDQHPDLLNVANGVVDLRTGYLLAHDKALMLTTVTPTDYLPGATHQDWDAALEAVPADTRGWLAVKFGQAITGHQPDDDKVTAMQGIGSNGKTVIADALRSTLGEDHATVVPEKVLVTRPGDHPTELMTLRGARLALIEELPGGATLDIKRLKTVAGTGTITARAICKDNVCWSPTHSLFLTTNYLPHVSESDHGTWRRLQLIPFPYTFRRPGETLRGPDDCHGDPTLRERLRRGADGQREAVLAWLVDGARRWYEADRVMPDAPLSVVEATRAWRTSADVLLRFADEHLMFDDPNAHVMSAELYAEFSDWLTANGNKEWSDQRFTERLQGHSALMEHRLVKKLVRQGKRTQQTLSRRRSAFSYGPDTRAPARYHAWYGVRFRTDDDDLKER